MYVWFQILASLLYFIMVCVSDPALGAIQIPMKVAEMNDDDCFHYYKKWFSTLE